MKDNINNKIGLNKYNLVSKMALIISEKSHQSMIDAALYFLGIVSEETNQTYALISIISESEAERYSHFLVNKVPHNERKQVIISDIPNKSKPLALEDNIYNKLVEFINDNCIFNEFASVKAAELSTQFTKATGIPVDIRRAFPKMMAQFMETRSDVSKKTTCKGVIYKGLTLLPEENRMINLRIREPTSANVSAISRMNSQQYVEMLNKNSVEKSDQNTSDEILPTHIIPSHITIPQNTSNNIPTIGYNSNLIEIPKLERT